jgi:DNA repair exonuclease SbcCD ATPase subunit
LKKQIQLYDQSLQMKNMLESKLTKQTNDLQIVKENINKTQKNVLIAEESKRLIKSYSLQKFQETLDSIGETASDILRNVPNMATASIYFEGCKETGSGSIKEEVTAFINMDGESDVDIKSLSGGERTAIDLAVDLAVIDILEVKAGKGADFFILDEPFDGLDSVGRAAIVDIIKGIDSNKRIIIVDHGAETKEIISDEVVVPVEVTEVIPELPVTAADLRSMADKLSKQAAEMRRKADEMAPPVKKAAKATKAEA